MRSIRAVRRRELFRIAAGELLGLTDVADVGAGLSRLTDATLEATLAVVREAVRAEKGLDAAPGPDGDGGDGPVRRVRAVLRQRRGRVVRPRRRRGRRPARGGVVRPGGRRGAAAGCSRCQAATRPWRWTPTCVPRASRGRWCAAWTPTRPTTRSGRRCGRRRRCCAPTPWSATPTCAASSRSSSTRCAIPRPGSPRRTWRRYAGSRRESTRKGCRGAPTPRPTSSSVVGDWPASNGPCSSFRCGTAPRSPGSAPPAPWRRSPRLARPR